jgi:hypothetical protein
MLANFFNKSKPAVVFVIAICLFVYFIIANLMFKFHEISWLFIVQVLGLFLCFVLFLIIFKFIINKNNLTQDNSYALLFTVFILATFYESLFATEIFYANVILLLSYRKIYSLRSGINTKLKLFDAAFWIGISTLVYSWSILYLLLIYFAMIIFKKVTFKNLMIPMVGIGIPIFIIFTYCFAVDDLVWFNQLFVMEMNFNYVSYNQFKLLIPISFLLTIVLWSIVSVTPKVASGGANFKKIWNLLILHLLIAAAVIGISPIKNGSEMIFMVFPLTLIITNFIQKSESKNFKNLVFYLFLLISIGVYFL